MKILLSSIVYRPEQVGFRAHDLASGLVELGHDVVSITGLPSYPHGHVYDGYHVRPWQWEHLDGVKLLRLPYVMDRSRASVRRIASYTYFSILTLGASLLQHWRPDVIWTNQVGYPGIWLKALTGVPLVHEVQDLWPEWAKTANFGFKEWLYKILDRRQLSLYSKADRITVITKGFKRWLIDKGVPEDKIDVIPNWADYTQYHPVPRDEKLGVREGLYGHFNVIYTGNIGAAQALGVVLDAARKLEDLSTLQFVIIGEGLEKDQLIQQAKNMNLKNVCFLGQRPTSAMSEYLAWADVLFLHLKHDPAYEITIPSKTYSYLASGKFILAAASGDVADLIQECKAGIAIQAEDPDILAATVRQLHKMAPAERESFGQNAARAAITKFDRMHLIQQYEEVFTSVVSGKR